jgi:predicted nucleotidyltransferase
MNTSRTALHSFADRIVTALKSDPRFVGLLAGGSFGQGDFDEYSDLDLVLVIEEDDYAPVMTTRHEFAASLGDLLYAFTGEHVGEPRLLICLYADPLMHVDLKFVTLDDLDKRIEEPRLLWHRDDRIPQRLRLSIPRRAYREPEWFEERFWVWVHYTATKLGRGEIFETHLALAQLRLLVLGPMAARRVGSEQRGVRRLEMLAPDISRQLAATVGDYSAGGCAAALRHTFAIYRDFRSDAPPRNQNREAENAVIEFVDRIIERTNR